MTRRGRSVLALALIVYLAAWAFGSKPLYPVATGLILVSLVAWAWVHLANGAFRAERRFGEHEHVEGDDVQLSLTLTPPGALHPPIATLAERVGRLGEQQHVLHRRGRKLAITYVLEQLPRGRYPFEESRIELSDPFGLQLLDVPLPTPGALLVYPRIVRIDHLFSESGAHAHDGRRLLLRRPSGFDLHSVREYERGESLRKVHWRSTARRGILMVKELEDEPRDEVAVVLDADSRAVAGDSFDVQVRAAASILDMYVRRGKRAALVVNTTRRETQSVHAESADRIRALELLAAVEPGPVAPLSALLADEAAAATRALELVVVTAHVDALLADRLVHRALARRKTSLIYIDAATFVGASARPEPALLRLQATAVSVAVLRHGDDLATVLGGEVTEREAAHA